jgi:HAD superfamily phosphatase (TIGR01668 family)
MKFNFVPEYYFNTFNEASAEFLLSIGVKGIVLDVDNTLEPYENPTPGDHVVAWLDSLRENGISAAIVSNNGGDRIELFNKDLGLTAYYKAKKPFKKNVLNAMRDMGTSKENTVLMGDQVFTDVWAAHNTGIRAILVPPINDKKDILTRFKRLLEKPFLRMYDKKHRKG